MKKILIIDDDKTTATMLRTLFEMEGLEGVICSRADQVISDARREKPDVLLMDAHLADVDSLDILREIKSDPALRAIPVVTVSGMDRSEEFLPAGAAAFVLKPFKPVELMAVLKRTIQS
ncbi:MAG: response regulator [Anaerolineae bacterium]